MWQMGKRRDIFCPDIYIYIYIQIIGAISFRINGSKDCEKRISGGKGRTCFPFRNKMGYMRAVIQTHQGMRQNHLINAGVSFWQINLFVPSPPSTIGLEQTANHKKSKQQYIINATMMWPSCVGQHRREA